MQELPASVGAALAAVPWELSWTRDFKELAHVNLQEALAARRPLSWWQKTILLRCAWYRASILAWSLVAWSKGRSSSVHLDGILRSCLGWHVLGDVYFQLIYVPTKTQRVRRSNQECSRQATSH